MASQRKIATATAAAGGLLAVGGATYAFADNQTPAPTPSASSSTSTDQAPAQNQQQSQDKTVTGTVADQVKAAVKAKDSSVTISEVRQDADGSYDALGTKSDGTKVFYDVSKDLKTVTANTAPQGKNAPSGTSTGN